MTTAVHHHFENVCWILWIFYLFVFVLFWNMVSRSSDWTPAKYVAKHDLNFIYLLFIFESERVTHWTLSLLLWLDWQASNSLGSPYFCLHCLGYKHQHRVWFLCGNSWSKHRSLHLPSKHFTQWANFLAQKKKIVSLGRIGEANLWSQCLGDADKRIKFKVIISYKCLRPAWDTQDHVLKKKDKTTESIGIIFLCPSWSLHNKL